MTPSLIILAAGMGSRYGGLKQVDPIGPAGETIIDYSIYDAIQAGFGKLVFIIRPDFESDFRNKITQKIESRISIECVNQMIEAIPGVFQIPPGRQKPWGTGQALLMARKVVQEPFGVINADDFYGPGSFQILHEFLKTPQNKAIETYGIVSFILKNTLSKFGGVSRGVCRSDTKGILKNVTELTKISMDGERIVSNDSSQKPIKLTGNELVSMNMWGFTPSVFPYLDAQFRDFLSEHGNDNKAEFYLSSVVNELLHGGKIQVKVLSSSDQWLGITYPNDKALVTEGIQSLIDQGKYPAPLWTK